MTIGIRERYLPLPNFKLERGGHMGEKTKINRGKKIEKLFQESAEKEDLCIIRLNDSATSWQGGAARFTPENPCDFLLYHYPFLYALELKSTIGTSFSIQRDIHEASKMIKAHQINSLIQLSQYRGITAGFIFDIYSEKENEEYVYFLSIENFSTFLEKTEKKSINLQDIKEYGGIAIETKKKRKWSNMLLLPWLEYMEGGTKKDGI